MGIARWARRQGPFPIPSPAFGRGTLLVFALSVLFSTALAALFLYWDHRGGVLEEAIGRQQLFATTLALAAQREISKAQQNLEFLAANPAMAPLEQRGAMNRSSHGAPPGLEAEKRRLFDIFLACYPAFSALFLALPDGEPTLVHPSAAPAVLALAPLAERSHFQEAVFQEAARTRRPVVSNSFLGADGEAVVVIDVPILDGRGEIAAHLGGVLRLGELAELVALPRIGESSAGFIADGTGALVAHTDPRLARSPARERFADHPLLRERPVSPGGQAQQPLTRVYTDPQDGESYLGTVVHLANGWSLALSRRMAEVETIAFRHSLRMAAGLAALMLLISGIAMVIARGLLRRGNAVETELRRAKEEMERRVEARGADLIASNRRLEEEIAERRRAEIELRAHRERLEELVSARASELMEANARLHAEIAERERSQAALQEREAHLRSVLANAPIVLFAIDREGRVTLSEGHGLLKRGRRPGQVVGLSVFEMYLDRPDIVSNMRRAMAGEQVTAQIELGGLIYETAYVPLRNEAGDPVGMIGVATDVTERVRAEAALRREEVSLARAQQVAHLGNWDWNLASNEMRWSEETFRILGRARAECAPSYEAFLEAVHPEDRERVRRAIGELIGRREPLVLEHRIRRPDGGERVVDLRAEVTYDRHARAVEMIGTLHDISERKGAEQELHAFAAKLERSNRDLQEFAYMVSHDLQEPLNTIHTMGERIWLRLDDLLADEDRRDFAQILGSASRMKLLIEKVLALSRVVTHAQPIAPVDLAEAARAVLEDLRVRIEEARGRVELGPLPTIEGDPVQLRQLLQNLIANGLKFHRPRHPPVVRVSARLTPARTAPEATPATCEITVEDNGIGFTDADAERIFTPFQRLEEGRQYKGSGVGLATCRRIAERHGGSIRATGRPGAGATFVVTLPVTQPEGKAQE